MAAPGTCADPEGDTTMCPIQETPSMHRQADKQLQKLEQSYRRGRKKPHTLPGATREGFPEGAKSELAFKLRQAVTRWGKMGMGKETTGPAERKA